MSWAVFRIIFPGEPFSEYASRQNIVLWRVLHLFFCALGNYHLFFREVINLTDVVTIYNFVYLEMSRSSLPSLSLLDVLHPMVIIFSPELTLLLDRKSALLKMVVINLSHYHFTNG